MYSRTSLLLRQVHNESTTIRQIHCKSTTSCTTHPQHIEVIEFFSGAGLAGEDDGWSSLVVVVVDGGGRRPARNRRQQVRDHGRRRPRHPVALTSRRCTSKGKSVGRGKCNEGAGVRVGKCPKMAEYNFDCNSALKPPPPLV